MTYIYLQIQANDEKTSIPHAPEEVIAEWHALAVAICGELQHVGLPRLREHSTASGERRAGACVSVAQQTVLQAVSPWLEIPVNRWLRTPP
ncbi:hypothetical protein [Streptomyces violascens]|uniref:hypothetical protein n=1 Tax=Streptomyces TaxID=1883 RepID=UPI0036CBE585